jgi:hypothetical protein
LFSGLDIVVSHNNPIIQAHIIFCGLPATKAKDGTMITAGEDNNLALTCEPSCSGQNMKGCFGTRIAEPNSINCEALGEKLGVA